MSGKGFIRPEVYLIPVFILHTIEAQVAVLNGNPANQHISRSQLYAACIDSNDGAFPISAVPFKGSSMQFSGCILFPRYQFFDSPYPGVKVCMVHIAFFLLDF